MTISSTVKDNCAVLLIDGRVDTNTSPQLQSAILNAFQRASHIVLDFEKVPYISSAGLRDVAGLPYADIARTLGLEDGTVKSRLARARAALRKILIERGNISRFVPSKQAEGRRADDE